MSNLEIEKINKKGRLLTVRCDDDEYSIIKVIAEEQRATVSATVRALVKLAIKTINN